MTARHKGHVDKQPDGTIRWWLKDSMGFGLEGTMTPDPAGGYFLEGQFIKPDWSPDIPGVDTEL